MKIDPYKHKEKYLRWKESVGEQIKGISKENSKIILEYIFDMEQGINVSRVSKKGSRSYIRLNNLRQRIIFIIKKFESLYGLKDITKITEREIHSFFSGLRNGTITRVDGRPYESPVDYVKIFKAFWHWYQKVSRKKGVEIEDITIDLDTSSNKPKWVYLTEEQVKRLCEEAKSDYKVLIMFLFDSGIRSPTELMNIRVSDLYNDYKEVNVREEISKTFGRRIKLMLCSSLIKDFIEKKNLEREDYLFKINPTVVNRYLKRLGERVFGNKESPAGENYSKLTMYDFRHCSCCYWLPRYKSESALKYRFGWKKSEKIHYYSELLGMRDTISEEDLLVDVTKTEIENRLTKTEGEKEVLQERVDALEEQLRTISHLVKRQQVLVVERR